MRTTYLVKSDSPEMNGALVEITGEEWYEITKLNASLPKANRRYFIRDTIMDGSESDSIVIEVDRSEYRKWKAERQTLWRHSNDNNGIVTLSLDMPIINSETLSLMDTIEGTEAAENAYFAGKVIEDLKAALIEWKPWALDLLEEYLKGSRHITKWLADQCGVSEQMARRYRRSFEEFVKKFLA